MIRLALPGVVLLYERGEGPCLYLGRKHRALYISPYLALHKGWRSHPRWMKGGWEYYQPALLIGHQGKQWSRWFKAPTILMPAELVHLWRMRRKSYREAFQSAALKDGDAIPGNNRHS